MTLTIDNSSKGAGSKGSRRLMLWEGSSKRSERISNGITGAHRKGMRLVSSRRMVIVIDGRVIIDECCIILCCKCWYLLDGFSSLRGSIERTAIDYK